ncbi:MAG: carbohydrate ABC transporter permease [Caldilineaceae bacterium]|nr:carbohydrate ABC transporter permease [Caldilineaceae bacterium]MDE0462448.1 carbohydrate ABC transporter permease [Caldilineaceae bacterium]MYC23512.1 carbohydrate ABC transporter permease [Caldilineaceae bacterium SB0662_bin_25]
MTTSVQATPATGPRFSAIRIRNGFLVSLANVLLLIGVVLAAVPFIYMISASFKPQNEIFTFPVQIIPKEPYLDNYITLFGETLYLRWFFNTAIVAVGRTALSLFLCMLAGFAFAKYDFPFRRVLFILVLASFTLPFEVVLIPLYTMMVRLGWLNTYWVLIIPFAASAFGIFLARQYALALPTELMEAARIDGSSELGIFFRIALPNLRPALAVMGIIFFQASWNDFLWPLIVLNDSTMYVINLALPTLRGPYNDQYGLVLGGAVIAVIPIIIIFFAMQRYFIEGIMAGALKG